MTEAKKGDGPLVAHARRELELAGLFDKTEEYDGSIARGSLALVKLFESWTKDDAPKMQPISQCFQALITGELLSPPTTSPDEWEEMHRDGKTIYRNKRSPFYMTSDPSYETWINMATQEEGLSKNHITGEVPDVTGRTKSNEKANAGGETKAEQATPTKETETSKESDSSTADHTRPRSKSTLVEDSVAATEAEKKRTAKPPAGEDSK